MGKTSSNVKQQWNARHYKQVKISVKPETADAFKKACILSDVSMASVLSQHMEDYSKVAADKKGYAPDLSERRKRRAFVQSLVRQLERVRDNEEHYRDSIPENLQGSNAFERADQCVSALDDAIELLESAF